MSAAAEGGRLVDLARQTSEALEDGVVTGNVNQEGVQGGAIAGQFPRKFSAREPMDDVIRMRQQLSDGQGNTPFGKLQYSDDIARYLIRKEQAVEAANFDAWFNANYNKNDLASRQLAQEINPEFYSERERMILERAQEAAKLKIIQLRGPRSKEELYKVWLLNTGRVQLPDDWDRVGANFDAPPAGNRSNFKRGLVHIPKFRTGAERQAGASNPPNPFGSGAQALNGAQFAPLNNADVANNLFSSRPNSQADNFLSSWLK